MDNPITNDVFLYLIDNFLSGEEKTILRLLNKTYRSKYNNYVNIKTLVKNGNIDTIKELTIEFPTDIHTFSGLLEYGNIDLLNWIKDNSMINDRVHLLKNSKYIDLYGSAAKSGKVEVLQWLNTNINIKSTYYGFNKALDSKSLEVVKWCYECAKKNDRWILDYIPNMTTDRYKFTFEVFCWLFAKVEELDTGLSKVIFYTTDIVTWLINNNKLQECEDLEFIKWDIFTCAIKGGNIQLLELLKNNGIMSPEIAIENDEEFTAFYEAFNYGNIEVMKWLYVNGYRWCSMSLANIIMSCKDLGEDKTLEILEWVMDYCKSNIKLYEQLYGYCGPNIRLIKFLIKVQCPLPNHLSIINDYDLLLKNIFLSFTNNEVYHMILTLCKSGNLNMLKWLISTCGYNIADIEKEYAKIILDILHISDVQMDGNTVTSDNTLGMTYIMLHFIANACKYGNLEVVQFLYNAGCKYIPECSFMAAREGHIHILKWMKSNNLKIQIPQDEEWNIGKYISKQVYDFILNR
ncbi:Ankyrin-repeat protein [Orpheovirus IHUMI-LCC2]|uniref:Ankyrin-repeat protein n=1 Tax=Orpheovirus IHUMI-LCC2 TaxID=2023057 RepID=A0A2I2L4A3_9VIRU|nr:Ankyrin-repeat protein [Orpheovirus IHUMI-LCC2]SNW62358.1 Ankyrin-repeat protein [Orpheovirus IHUMI-LCC2]